MGSSPLTRGKRHRTAPRRGRRGLIPAHAGKTWAAGNAYHVWQAHPRSRGENGAGIEPAITSPGSSPLTRGKLTRAVGTIGVRGLIPAHAGKTSASPEPSRSSRAHPRSRGENQARQTGALRSSGSSPLTRGKPCRKLLRVRAAAAHPRSRGENFACGAAIAKNVGSSPLTRGKLLSSSSLMPSPRLIPAHAGKTEALEWAARELGAHPRSRGENMTPESDARPNRGSSPLTRGKPQAGRPA